ncbi:MAG: hypothetical protein ACI8QD_002895 [Cyclobacteriaceae bacterium]|jgi:hypothetical protein
MGDLLNRQNIFFLQNEQALIDKYKGLFIVIQNEKVADSFGSERDAYIYSVQHFKMGTFLIREVIAKLPAES